MIATNTKNTALRRQMAALMHSQTGVAPSRLLTLNFEQIGLDSRDLFDIILEVEKNYQVVIPDEVPLHSLDDFVFFIQSQHVSTGALSLV